MFFFLPQSGGFSECKKGSSGDTYARVGCQLIETCLATSEGIKFLVESEFLQQVCLLF